MPRAIKGTAEGNPGELDAIRRRKLLEAMNAGYARLRADPQAWAEELAEHELWDQTLADGELESEVTSESPLPAPPAPSPDRTGRA
jgi:hypothetical protein